MPGNACVLLVVVVGMRGRRVVLLCCIFLPFSISDFPSVFPFLLFPFISVALHASYGCQIFLSPEMSCSNSSKRPLKRIKSEWFRKQQKPKNAYAKSQTLNRKRITQIARQGRMMHEPIYSSTEATAWKGITW